MMRSGNIIVVACIAIAIALIFGLVKVTDYAAPYIEKFTPYKEDRGRVEQAKWIIKAHEQGLVVRQRQEQAETEQRKSAEVKHRTEEINEAKIRTFSLKNAPEIWLAVQRLRAEEKALAEGLSRVEDVLSYCGRDSERDTDFAEIRRELIEIRGMESRLKRSLEDAYLKYVAYQAQPVRKDLQDLADVAIKDGLREASLVEGKFKMMRERK